jgi:O-antigen/teichoic acid export membrane protein
VTRDPRFFVRFGRGRAKSFLSTIRTSLLAREVGGLWAAQVFALGTGLVQAVVVARILGPRDFGTAALVLSSTTLVFSLVDPQAREAVVKYLGAHHATGRTEQALAVPKVAYGADVLLGAVAFLIVAAGAQWFERHVVHDPHSADLLVIFAAAMVFAAPAATSRAVLTTFRRFPTVALLQAASSLLRVVIMVVLVAGGHGIEGVVYATAISIVVECLWGAVLADRELRRNLGRSWILARRSALGPEFRSIVRFMVYTDLSSLAAVFVKEADVVVLGYVGGPTQAGYYRLARSVTAPMTALIVPLQQVIYPRLAAMAGLGDHAGIHRAVRRYMLKVGGPLSVAAVLAVGLLPFVVPAVAGPAYRPAVGAAAVLFVGTALTLPAFWTRPVLLAGGHLRFLLVVSVGGTILTVAGYFLLGNLFDAVGVALSRVVFAGVGGSVLAALYFFRVHPAESRPVPDPTTRTSLLLVE